MKITILKNGDRKVELTLGKDEEFLILKNEGYYKLGCQMDDVVNASMTRFNNIELALRSHTNLSMFEAIISLLESGAFYSGVGSDKAMDEIRLIAKKEQSKLITMHDKYLEGLRERK